MWESKVAPLSGVVFAVLLVGSALIANNYDFMPPAEEVAAFYSGDSVRIMTSAYVGLLSAFALLWFSGSVYSSLRRIDDDNGRLSLLAFGGGVFASAMVALGFLTMMAGAERAGIVEVIDPGAAAVLFDLSGLVVGTGAAFGLAALIGAWAVVNLRTEGRMKPIGWAGGLIALGLISPFSWIVIGLALIWIPAAGVWIYHRDKTQVGETGALV